MKRSVFFSSVTAMLMLSLLAGCSSLNELLAPDRVNYKGVGSAPSLAVPSDLNATKLDQSFTAPPADATFGGAPTREKTAAGNAVEGVPSTQDPYGMHIERDGDRRWLVVDGRSPDQLWPQLQTFWKENGFSLKTDAPITGIMETNWAENRANIPNDWFRRTVGKLIDFAYSSGTRDKFRTLVERGSNDSTDISITHSALEEVLTGRDKDSSRWVERPRNPQLEVVFLDMLMQKFGLTPAQAKELLDDARPSSSVAHVETDEGATVLDLSESFDRAWLRVGLALDRTNFMVVNRNRTKGIYYVRYADSLQALKGEGLFGKLFYNEKNARKSGAEFMVNVRGKKSNLTQVAVVDADGQIDTSSEAHHIVALLRAQLN